MPHWLITEKPVSQYIFHTQLRFACYTAEYILSKEQHT